MEDGHRRRSRNWWCGGCWSLEGKLELGVVEEVTVEEVQVRVEVEEDC